MVNYIKGSRHIKHAYTSQLPPVYCLDPVIIHLDHGCGGAVEGPEAMVVGMKQVIGTHILYYLEEHCSFNDFTYYAENGYRSIILGKEGVVLLEERDNLCFLIERRK